MNKNVLFLNEKRHACMASVAMASNCPFQSIHRTRGPAIVDKLYGISHIQI